MEDGQCFTLSKQGAEKAFEIYKAAKTGIKIPEYELAILYTLKLEIDQLFDNQL